MLIWEQWAGGGRRDLPKINAESQQKMMEDGVLAPPVVLVLEHVATYATEPAPQSLDRCSGRDAGNTNWAAAVIASAEEGVPPEQSQPPSSEPEVEPVELPRPSMPMATSTDTAELLCEGRVQIQFSGKGEFVPVWLSLNYDGVLTCRSVSVYMNGELVHGGPQGRILRTGSAVGCDISVPKTARKLFDAKSRKYVIVSSSCVLSD